MQREEYKPTKESMSTYIDKPPIIPGVNIPEELILDADKDSGCYLGLELKNGERYYVGKAVEAEGNIVDIGPNGSGKSSVLAKSTMGIWKDSIIALDIKGELTTSYSYLRGACNRGIEPFIVFNPEDTNEFHYDPFAQMEGGGKEQSNMILELSNSIIERPIDVREAYWIDLARTFLAGAIAYCRGIGLNFSESMAYIYSRSAVELCKEIQKYGNEMSKAFLNDISGLNDGMQATIKTEVNNNIMVMATDERLQAALEPGKNGKTFSWKDVVNAQTVQKVFLCIPQAFLEQWSGMLRMMLTQLIRELERRPDKYEPKAKNLRPVLIMLDEFPALGRMSIIANALSTLRSKNVTFRIMIQSLAQLDVIYGADMRRIIMDNCQYKVMLNITEPDSQEYFSKLVGTVSAVRKSISHSYSIDEELIGLGTQEQELRISQIQPHEFAENKDLWIHTPQGFISTIKLPVTVTYETDYEYRQTIKEYFVRRYRHDD